MKDKDLQVRLLDRDIVIVLVMKLHEDSETIYHICHVDLQLNF